MDDLGTIEIKDGLDEEDKTDDSVHEMQERLLAQRNEQIANQKVMLGQLREQNEALGLELKGRDELIRKLRHVVSAQAMVIYKAGQEGC